MRFAANSFCVRACDQFFGLLNDVGLKYGRLIMSRPMIMSS